MYQIHLKKIKPKPKQNKTKRRKTKITKQPTNLTTKQTTITNKKNPKKIKTKYQEKKKKKKTNITGIVKDMSRVTQNVNFRFK